MEIRTFDTIYSVIHADKTQDRMPVYLCKNQSDGQLYHLFQMEKAFLNDQIITFLNTQFRNRNFTDFSDIFIYQGKFYAALRYYSLPTIEKKMKEHLGMEERLVIGSKVLESFLLTKMPPYFCCKCLAKDQLLLTESLDIQFAYTLDDIELAPVVKMQDCYDAYALLLEDLWEMELKNKTVPEIQDFIQFLHSAGNVALEDVYQKYRDMYQAFIEVQEEERKKPRKVLFLLWERIRRNIPRMKKIAAVLILFAVIAYLIYTIQEEKKVTGEAEKMQIKYIGTLKVEE